MITILADLYCYSEPPPDAVVAEGIAAYVGIRQRIRQALNHQTNLTIYVTDPVLLRWLNDLQRYPAHIVRWHALNPMAAFAKRFGVEAAPPFTPELLTKLNLDTLPAIRNGVSVEPVSWILGQRLDAVWDFTLPSGGHVAHLAAWAAQHQEPLDPILQPLIETQLARWAEHDAVYHAFHPQQLHADGTALLLRFALQHYDAGWRNAQAWGRYPLIDANEQWLTCIDVLRHQHAVIIGYWQQRFATANRAADLIPFALKHMSGLSKAEADALVDMLTYHPQAITDSLVTQVQQRFAHLPDCADIVVGLRARVVPPLPALPDAGWSTTEWLHWATEVYLPYFAWTVRYSQDRHHQQACAQSFSDWLYDQYPSWLNDDKAPLLMKQYQELRTILDNEPNAVVIWLIVDGLAWWQGSLLRTACAKQGLHVHKVEPAVAVLPSITRISKRALATGEPSTRETSQSIAEAARAKLQRLDIKSHVGYQFPATVEVAQRGDDTRCLMVFFNTLDVLAHQTLNFTDDSGIRGYIDELAANLGQLRSIYEQQGRVLHVLVGSDHGATLLPKDAQSIGLPVSSQAVDDMWETEITHQEAHQKPSARAATLTHLGHLSSQDLALWYVLEREQFQLDHHYLIPRGYNYVGRRPTGWTHGGLTPEEVIVPLMHLTSQPPQRLPIEVKIVGQLRVSRQTLQVVIVNPNRFPVEMFTLTVGQGTLPVEIKRLGPLNSQKIEVEFPGITDGTVAATVPWQLRYVAINGAQIEQGQQTVAVQRLQSDDSDFGDFFGDS